NVGQYYAPLASLSLGASSAMGWIRPARHGYKFTANPFVIYGALGTAITYARHLAAERYGASDHHFLPYRIGRLAVLAALDGASYRSHAQLRSCEPEAIAFDIDVVDESEQLVLRIEEIVLRRVAQAKLLPAR